MTNAGDPLRPQASQPAIEDEGVAWVAPEVVDYLGGRTATREAAFFIRHLDSKMSLLDCGCGPGSITVDLAQRVALGQVVGIDREPAQIEKAQQCAAQRGVANVEFRVGNVYEIPYPAASFDAVFAHAVLQHLSEPMRALQEIHRVLKPGGIIGVREEDRDADLIHPQTPSLQQAHELLMRLWQQVGGNPYLPKRYRTVLREAGFARVQMTASCEYRSHPEATRGWAGTLASFLQDPELAALAIELGWANHSSLQAMVAALRSWGDDPDAFWCETWCEAVGWKA